MRDRRTLDYLAMSLQLLQSVLTPILLVSSQIARMSYVPSINISNKITIPRRKAHEVNLLYWFPNSVNPNSSIGLDSWVWASENGLRYIVALVCGYPS